MGVTNAWIMFGHKPQPEDKLKFPLEHPHFVTRRLEKKNCFFVRSGDLSLDGLLSAPICSLCLLSSSLYLAADITFFLPLTSTAFFIFFPPDFLYSNWFSSHGITLFQLFLHANQFLIVSSLLSFPSNLFPLFVLVLPLSSCRALLLLRRAAGLPRYGTRFHPAMIDTQFYIRFSHENVLQTYLNKTNTL